MSAPKKLVLAVIDAMKPSMLERAIASGRAPALAQIQERGAYVGDCVAAYPSVTPVCAATITTGVGPDQHLIPNMNWYHREEGRYIEYGSSFSASRQFGVLRSLTDTVYRMNAEHLSPEVETVFETLDDAHLRTAGTTYLIYRGRHEHEVAQESALARIVTSTLFRRTILGPQELFYADLYASRKTGCRGQLGLPGARDQHTGCVGSYLVEHDLFDFLLYSLPDNDAYSHRNGPHAQVTSLAAADRQLERLMHAAGGPEQFFNDYAVIVCSDHSQAPVEEHIRLDEAFADFSVARPSPSRIGPRPPEIAISPAQRSAMLYALDPDLAPETVRRCVETVAEVEGIDLTMWLDNGEGVIRGRRGELRFAAGGDLQDPRGERWSVDGDLAVLRAEIQDGRLLCTEYPDALARVWSALRCPNAGDVLLSAAPGYEFVDWGAAPRGDEDSNPETTASSGRCATSPRSCARTSDCRRDHGRPLASPSEAD
jgi:hypothetical protein